MLHLVSPVDFRQLNLSVEEVYSPAIHDSIGREYSLLYPVSLTLYALLMYAIVTKSPHEMSMYRWVLAYEITSTLVFDTMIVLSNPVLLFPLRGGYSNGYLPESRLSYHTILMICCSAVAVMTHAVCVQVIYRFVVILAPNLSTRFWAAVMLLGFVALQSTMALPTLLESPKCAEFQERVLMDSPQLAPLFQQRHLICGFYEGITVGYIELVAIFVAIITTFIAAMFLLAIPFSFILLKRIKHKLLPSSHAIHRMLVWAMFTQMLLKFCLIVVPFVAFGASMVLSVRRGSTICTWVITLIAHHTPCEIVSQIILIKPYRHFFFRLLCQITKKPWKGRYVQTTNFSLNR